MVCKRCSSNLNPPQPGTRSAALDESSAGTHQPLRRTPSELGISTSSYPTPKDAGVAQGGLRFGPVIQSTTSHPAPRYTRDRMTRRTSMRRGDILLLLVPVAKGLLRSSSNHSLLRPRR